MKSRVAILLLLGMTFGGRDLLACSCIRPGPMPCGKFDPTEIAFVGTVESIENPPPEFGRGEEASSDDDSQVVDQSGLSRYRFRIDEKISGASTDEIDVFSGRGGGDCSYHFQNGGQYLVFPYKSKDGKLMATICSNTRPVEYGQAMLGVLRAMRDHRPVASLYGALRSVQQPYGSVGGDYYGKTMANTRMTLRSGESVLETMTDANGDDVESARLGRKQLRRELSNDFEGFFGGHAGVEQSPRPAEQGDLGGALPESRCFLERRVRFHALGDVAGYLPKPHRRPDSSRKAVMITLAIRREPSLRTRQFSSSKRPSFAAVAKARSGLPAAMSSGV